MENDIASEWKQIIKDGNAILTFSKIDFKTDCNKRQGEVLHSDKGVNPAWRHNIYEYIFTQYKSTKISKASINGHKRRSWQQYNNSRGLWHHTSINKQIIETENQEENIGFKQR